MTGAMPTLLAHAGAGAGWQALLTVVSIGLGVLFLLAVAGRLKLDEPGDLVLPVSAVLVISALSPVASQTLSDWVGYAVPAGAVALAALLLAALTAMDLRGSLALAGGFVVLAAVLAVASGPSLTRAWHPKVAPLVLPVADDATIAITGIDDGAAVPAGTLTVTVTVSGGSIGPVDTVVEDAPSDLEEFGQVSLFVDGTTRLDPVDQDRCTLAEPCTSLTFEVPVEPGEHRLDVEFLAWNRFPFTPAIDDSVTFTAGPGT